MLIINSFYGSRIDFIYTYIVQGGTSHHGDFTHKEIPYHVRPYWGIKNEENTK